jgi:antitoxin MazE
VSKTATLPVQRWGNSLAVRIPAAVAWTARFKVGQRPKSWRDSAEALRRPSCSYAAISLR